MVTLTEDIHYFDNFQLFVVTELFCHQSGTF